MTVRDAARRLEISTSLCYEIIAEGRLACCRVGRQGRRGKILVTEADLQKFLESVRIKTGSRA